MNTFRASVFMNLPEFLKNFLIVWILLLILEKCDNWPYSSVLHLIFKLWNIPVLPVNCIDFNNSFMYIYKLIYIYIYTHLYIYKKKYLAIKTMNK